MFDETISYFEAGDIGSNYINFSSDPIYFIFPTPI